MLTLPLLDILLLFFATIYTTCVLNVDLKRRIKHFINPKGKIFFFNLYKHRKNTHKAQNIHTLLGVLWLAQGHLSSAKVLNWPLSIPICVSIGTWTSDPLVSKPSPSRLCLRVLRQLQLYNLFIFMSDFCTTLPAMLAPMVLKNPGKTPELKGKIKPPPTHLWWG